MKRTSLWLVIHWVLLVPVACAQANVIEGFGHSTTTPVGTMLPVSEIPVSQPVSLPVTQTPPIGTEVTPDMNIFPIPTPLEPSLQKLVVQAQADLAQRLAIPLGQIELVAVQSVTWPDASLGCPQPGMGYLQVQVDGLLIRLRAGSRLYEYHSGGSRPLFLCESSQ